jgi:hypothetical protein
MRRVQYRCRWHITIYSLLGARTKFAFSQLVVINFRRFCCCTTILFVILFVRHVFSCVYSFDFSCFPSGMAPRIQVSYSRPLTTMVRAYQLQLLALPPHNPCQLHCHTVNTWLRPLFCMFFGCSAAIERGTSGHVEQCT